MDKIELKQLVERCVREQIYNLIEYAHPRKVFIERVEYLSKQIIIHYCLIKYYKYIGNFDYINHWKNELVGWISNIANIEIKGNNSKDARYKAIMQAFDNMGYLSNDKQILNAFAWKAKTENVNLSDNIISTIIHDCQNDLIIIADIMAENNPTKCFDFIDKI